MEISDQTKSALDRAEDVLGGFFDDFVSRAPLFVIAAFFLLICFFITRFIAGRIKQFIIAQNRDSNLLAQLIAQLVWIPALILSGFLALKIAGFSNLAFTFLGGTGILGLVLGFAFKDIGENFLASLLIGIHRPFKIGDIIQIENLTGVVDSVTSRGTMIMSFEGNHIHIPNTTVYKSVVHNLTANPKMRMDFEVGVGFDVDLSSATEVAKDVLSADDSVLDDPKPMILVEKFGSATMSLRVYFWTDIVKHSGLKVRSRIVKKVKQAFEENGISMPDEAREIIFPEGVPILNENKEIVHEPEKKSPAREQQPPKEDDVSSDIADLKEQMLESRVTDDQDRLV